MNAPYNKIRCLDFPHSFWAMQTRAGVCLVMLKRLLPVWMGALQQLGAAQVALAVNKLSPNARRDVGSVPGLARSPGGGHGSPLQYSCLENLMNRGAWWATVHRISKNQTLLMQLSKQICRTISVQFSHSVMSNSLRPHGLQHTRLPCPSPTPGVCSNSCPSSQWCHPTISSSVIPFSSHLQSFPASGSFPMSQLFTSDGQSIGVSASASVLPVNIQDRFPFGLTGLISCSPRDSQESSPTPQFKSINSSALRFLYSPALTSIHDYSKNYSFDYMDLCWQSDVFAF